MNGTTPSQGSSRSRRQKVIFISAGAGLFLALILTLLFLHNARRVFVIDGSAMEPTFPSGTLVEVHRWGYQLSPGDVVVFNQNLADASALATKRVIATEGQTVAIDYTAGTVSVDDMVLDEPYRSKEPMLEPPFANVKIVTVPDNSVFVLGDNRNHSSDSRDPRLGCVKVEDIVGRVTKILV